VGVTKGPVELAVNLSMGYEKDAAVGTVLKMGVPIVHTKPESLNNSQPRLNTEHHPPLSRPSSSPRFIHIRHLKTPRYKARLDPRRKRRAKNRSTSRIHLCLPHGALSSHTSTREAQSITAQQLPSLHPQYETKPVNLSQRSRSRLFISLHATYLFNLNTT
jgi:hypothetical protein